TACIHCQHQTTGTTKASDANAVPKAFPRSSRGNEAQTLGGSRSFAEIRASLPRLLRLHTPQSAPDVSCPQTRRGQNETCFFEIQASVALITHVIAPIAPAFALITHVIAPIAPAFALITHVIAPIKGSVAPIKGS